MMKMDKIKALFALLLFSLLFAVPVPAGAGGCEGPAELCAQVQDLNQRIAELKRDKATGEASAGAAKEEKLEERVQKVIAAAGIISVALKMLLSGLASWKPYFKTDKGKAWLKVITVVVGLTAFIASNVGMGIPFWQSLILAGGGPASMAVHSIWQMIPVILGKSKLPASVPPGPPSGNPA